LRVLRFLVRRLAASLVVVWIVATASFLLLHAAPGGPFESDARRSDAVQAAIEERYGLHDSLIVQYGREMSHLARGDLGHSLARDASVNDLIAEHFPVSALVGVLGLLTAVVFGVALGVAAAHRRDTWVDYVAMALSAIAISVPAFVLGPLLVATVAMRLDWLPPARIDGASSYVLPAISLGMVYLGTIARLARGGMREALAQDFVRTARAKGAGERAVVWRHALRVGIAPVVTYLGPATAALISGSFVVEKIFQIPGLGAYFLDAIVDRDYPVLTGVLVFYAVLLVLLNLAVDVTYGLLDPRIRR
jgi:ABC-type dipeptide/oligopeptide/nickel transport system permease component